MSHFLGAVGCLAGLGLILPGALHVFPILTAYAAVSVAVESILITTFYIKYGDRSPMNYSIAMVAIASFIAYGRFVLSPL